MRCKYSGDQRVNVDRGRGGYSKGLKLDTVTVEVLCSTAPVTSLHRCAQEDEDRTTNADSFENFRHNRPSLAEV
jgi:sorbitol-specific phosphotransferase system component IIBC